MVGGSSGCASSAQAGGCLGWRTSPRRSTSDVAPWPVVTYPRTSYVMSVYRGTGATDMAISARNTKIQGAKVCPPPETSDRRGRGIEKRAIFDDRPFELGSNCHPLWPDKEPTGRNGRSSKGHAAESRPPRHGQNASAGHRDVGDFSTCLNPGGRSAPSARMYRSQPIAALDGRTAEALVKSGQAGAVRDYVDHIALGGFA